MNEIIKSIVKKTARSFGFNITYFNRDGVEGVIPLLDMKHFIKTDQPVIFDVGANIGQSVKKFRKEFPRSIIHSFEPSPTTFETLKQQTERFDNVHLWNCGLAAASGEMTFLENTHSDMSSFLEPGNQGWGEIAKRTLVDVKTVDQFRSDEQIEKIDILKSDTQGFDFEVFKGAEQSIRENRIGLIYFEVTFSEMYKDLPDYSEIHAFLTSHGFSLVSFYRFYYQNRLASWTDAVWVHKSYL